MEILIHRSNNLIHRLGSMHNFSNNDCDNDNCSCDCYNCGCDNDYCYCDCDDCGCDKDYACSGEGTIPSGECYIGA